MQNPNFFDDVMYSTVRVSEYKCEEDVDTLEEMLASAGKTLSDQEFFADMNSIGTGFIIQLDIKNVSGKPLLYAILNKSVASATKGEFSLGFHLREHYPDDESLPVNWGYLAVNTYAVNTYEDADNYIAHPHPLVDLACLNITTAPGIFEIYWNGIFCSRLTENCLLNESEHSLFVGQEVWFVGYPDSDFDAVRNLPTIKRASIVSTLDLSLGGKPQFLIDVPITSGSNGSPVFVRLKDGQFRLAGILTITPAQQRQIDDPLDEDEDPFAPFIGALLNTSAESETHEEWKQQKDETGVVLKVDALRDLLRLVKMRAEAELEYDRAEREIYGGSLAELLQTVLGKMAMTIDPKKLQDDSARGRLGADLWNRRLAICAEAGNRKLDKEILKTLTGADTITVEFKYHEAFDATPRHVLLMVSNDPPQIDTYDEALRDRVVALPFVHRLDANGQLQLSGGDRIEAIRKDPDSLLVRGFTAWAVEGLERLYRKRTIHRALCIEEATERFWADADPLTPFWETVDEEELLKGVSSEFLHTRLKLWCEGEGERVPKGKAFGKACANRHLRPDFMTQDGKKVRSWILDPKWAKAGKVGKARNEHDSTAFDEISTGVEQVSDGFVPNLPKSVLSVPSSQKSNDYERNQTGSWFKMTPEEQDRYIRAQIKM